MNYKIVEALLLPEDSEKNCPVYKVVETKTQQIIETFSEHKKAKELLRHLNLGGGFDGFTPSFLLQNVSSYINKKR